MFGQGGFDLGAAMAGGGGMQPAQQQALPSAQMPGGGVPQSAPDPLSEGINITVATLKRLAEEAKMHGDEQFANELDQMANRITRRRLNREKLIDSALSKMQGSVLKAGMGAGY